MLRQQLCEGADRDERVADLVGEAAGETTPLAIRGARLGRRVGLGLDRLGRRHLTGTFRGDPTLASDGRRALVLVLGQHEGGFGEECPLVDLARVEGHDLGDELRLREGLDRGDELRLRRDLDLVSRRGCDAFRLDRLRLLAALVAGLA
jgi:hypothetical protein